MQATPCSSHPPKYPWQAAIDGADGDLKDVLILARTGKRNVLLAIRKVAQEKREQAVWTSWRYHTPEHEAIIVSDLLEKILSWIDVLRESGISIPKEYRSEWHLLWSPFWFLLRQPVGDVQAFGNLVYALEYAARLLVEYETSPRHEIEAFFSEDDTPKDTLVSVYDTVLHLLAHYIHITTGKTTYDSLTLQRNQTPWRLVLRTKEADVHLRLGWETNGDLTLRNRESTTYEIPITEELHGKIRTWISAGLMDSGIVSQSSNHETNSTTQVLELEELRYWWESSSSSILSIHNDEAETRDVCDAVRKAISSTSAEQKAPTPLVYVNCIGITSAEDILRYVVAKLTLSSQEPWKAWDTIISEYRVKQAFAEVKGQEVSPMNAQECLDIILNVAAASPVTLLLDQVQTQSIRQLLSSLVYAVDNSDHIVKILIATEQDLPEGELHHLRNLQDGTKLYRRNARSQQSWETLQDQLSDPLPGTALSAASPSEQEAALLIAIEAGDTTTLLSLIHHTPNITSHLPTNALFTAVFHNHVPTLSYLLTLSPFDTDPSLLTPSLHLAALNNRPRCARLLLSHNADPNAPNPTTPTFSTPLLAASARGHVRMLKLLLAHGANPNTPSPTDPQTTPLVAAACMGHASTIRALLAAGADSSEEALCGAADAGHEEVVRALMAPETARRRIARETAGMRAGGISRACKMPPSRYRSLLREASPGWKEESRKNSEREAGKREAEREWREKESAGMAAETRVERLVGIAAAGDLAGMENAVKSARSRRMGMGGVNRDRSQVLPSVAAAGQVAVVKLLMEQRELLDIGVKQVSSALEEAGGAGHLEIVRLLCESGIDLKRRTFVVALSKAMRNGHTHVVDFLLERSGSPEETEEFVRVILENACEGSDSLALRALQLAEERCSGGELAETRAKILRTAAENGRGQVITALLDSGPPFEKKTYSRALKGACRGRRTDIVLELINKDAQRMIEQSDLNECLEWTVSHGSPELSQALLAHPRMEKDEISLGNCLVLAASGGYSSTTQLFIEMLQGKETFLRAVARALAMAAHNGHPDLVQYLLNQGAYVNDAVPRAIHPSVYNFLNHISGNSQRLQEAELNALQWCIKNCNRFLPSDWISRSHCETWTQGNQAATKATIRILFDHGADVNAKGGHEMLPIHAAVRDCPLDIIQCILDGGATVQAAVVEDSSVLVDVATREADSGIIFQRLVAAGLKLEAHGPGIHPSIEKALEFFSGDIDMHNYHSRIFDPDGRFTNTDSITAALTEGPGGLIKSALELFPEEKAKDNRYGLVFQMAAAIADDPFLRLLLDRGVDVNDAAFYYGTALQAASRFGHLNTVQLLLSAGADVNVLQGRHQTALRAAVVGGHTDVVRLLLDHGADIDRKLDTESDGGTSHMATTPSALHLAVSHGHLDIARLLLRAGAEAHQDTSEGPSALMAACRRNDAAMVRLLLAHGAPVNYTAQPPRRVASAWGHEWVSALHVACANGHAAVVGLLLGAGADVELADGEKRRSPLMTAAGRGHAGVVRRLLDAGAEVDRVSGYMGGAGATALWEAADNGHLEVAEVLVAAGAVLHDPGRRENPLKAACKKGHLEVVEFLLEKVSFTGVEEAACLCAMEAAAQGWKRQSEVFKLLFEYAPADADALASAAAAGLNSVVRMLLESGVDVDAVNLAGNTALLEAAYHLHPDVVETLLEHGASISVTDESRGGPIMSALDRCLGSPKSLFRLSIHPYNATSGRFPSLSDSFVGLPNTRPSTDDLQACEKIVRLLIEHGADADDESPSDRSQHSIGSAIHVAAFLGSEGILTLLLDHGVDVNKRNGYFETPLFAAIQNSQAIAVKCLLERGADYRLVSETRGPPLHFACRQGARPVVQLLLRHGADPNLEDAKGVRPLALAIEARGRARGESVLDAFLQDAKNVQITQDDLLATVEEPKKLRPLLEYDESIVASEKLICAVLDKTWSGHDHDLLRMLMDRAGGIGVTAEMLKSVDTKEALNFLLAECSPVCSITPEILQNVRGLPMIDILLWYDKDVVPSEGVAFKALTTGNVYSEMPQHTKNKKALLEVIWERNPSLKISEGILLLANITDDVDFLMARAEPDLRISEAVIMTMARCSQCGEMLRTLFSYRKDLKMTEKTAVRALYVSSSNIGVWEALFEYQSHLEITAEMLEGIKFTEKWARLLEKCGKKLVLTAEIRQLIERKLYRRTDAPLKELIYSLTTTADTASTLHEVKPSQTVRTPGLPKSSRPPWPLVKLPQSPGR